MQTVFYLCRHGDYENPQKIFHGRLPGFPLSSQGKKQVQDLAQKLDNIKFSAIYSSPIQRAVQTASAIAKTHNLEVLLDERLLDIRSPLEGKTIVYMDTLNWNFYRPQFIKQGGEKISDIYKRMRSFINEKTKQHTGENVAVVSHADPIMSVKLKQEGKRLSLSNLHDPNYISMADYYKIVIDKKLKNFKA